jgi:hypothetical protein
MTPQDRKEIMRCLVERIVIRTEPSSEDAEATTHWAGGHSSHASFIRPVKDYAHLRNGDRLIKRIVRLREEGKSAAEITAILNEEGYRTIRPGGRFTAEIVRGLFERLGLRGEIADDSQVGRNEWWLRDLADELGMPWATLRGWAVRGWINARQTRVQDLWILWADKEELKRLRKLRKAISGGALLGPVDLTIPKQRPASK